MKQVKKSMHFLIFGLLIKLSSCDKLTKSEPEIYSNYFFINDTSDSLYVDFHYSHKSIADGKVYQGYKSYSLGLEDTISFYSNDTLPNFSCADTVWMRSPKMKLKLHDYYGFSFSLFYSNKRKSVSRGDHEYTYYFMDDTTLKTMVSYYEEKKLLDYYETFPEEESNE